MFVAAAAAVPQNTFDSLYRPYEQPGHTQYQVMRTTSNTWFDNLVGRQEYCDLVPAYLGKSFDQVPGYPGNSGALVPGYPVKSSDLVP